MARRLVTVLLALAAIGFAAVNGSLPWGP